jgi:hypothetical protein
MTGLSEADAEHTYTTIREFIGRHPLVSAVDLRRLSYNADIPQAALTFVLEHVYVPVHAWDSPDGREVWECHHCHGLITAQQRDWKRAACCLAGCREDHPTEIGSRFPVAEARVARPEVLKYWADPAREEHRWRRPPSGVPGRSSTLKRW